MSLDSVRAFLAEKAPDIAVIELATSTATVALAAQGHGVTPAQIAKTLSLRVREQDFLVVTSGDARLDNKKLKAAFGGKARMLSAEEVLAASVRSDWQHRCRCIATFRSKLSTRWSLRRAPLTVRCGSIRSAWPNWRRRIGWMFASQRCDGCSSGRIRSTVVAVAFAANLSRPGFAAMLPWLRWASDCQ
jgi:hypothetical protein